MKKSVLMLVALGFVVSLAGCSLWNPSEDASNTTGDLESNVNEVVEELEGAIETDLDYIGDAEEASDTDEVAEEVNVVDSDVTTGDVAEEINVEDTEEKTAE